MCLACNTVMALQQELQVLPKKLLREFVPGYHLSLRALRALDWVNARLEEIIWSLTLLFRVACGTLPGLPLSMPSSVGSCRCSFPMPS